MRVHGEVDMRKLIIGFVSGAAGIVAGCVALFELEQRQLRRAAVR